MAGNADTSHTLHCTLFRKPKQATRVSVNIETQHSAPSTCDAPPVACGFCAALRLSIEHAAAMKKDVRSAAARVDVAIIVTILVIVGYVVGFGLWLVLGVRQNDE